MDKMKRKAKRTPTKMLRNHFLKAHFKDNLEKSTHKSSSTWIMAGILACKKEWNQKLSASKRERKRERSIGRERREKEKREIGISFTNYSLNLIIKFKEKAAVKIDDKCHKKAMHKLPNGKRNGALLLPRVAPTWRHVSRAPGPKNSTFCPELPFFLNIMNMKSVSLNGLLNNK